MRNKIDITGRTYGNLTAIKYSHNERAKSWWICNCSCGSTVVAALPYLRNGSTKSCGCLAKQLHTVNTTDMLGLQFSRWTVIAFDEKRGNQKYWLCRCSCGKEKSVCGKNLRRGHSQSCGCVLLEFNKARISPLRTLHPAEYNVFQSLKQRCRDPKTPAFKYYGGRGIKCEFTSFADFFAEVGVRPTKRHSIERIDNDGNYASGNVKWATRVEQDANKRSTVIVSYKGKRVPLVTLEADTNLPAGMMWNRIFKLGWTVEEAVNTPPLRRVRSSEPIV